MDKTGKIFKAITTIMGELGAIGRDQKNVSQNFKYRGVDDLYNALSPLLSKYGVFTVPEVLEYQLRERATKSGSVQYHVLLKVRYRFFADDGSFVDSVVMGEGMDSGDKACNKAESVAHKYALTQVFVVRTSDQNDPDGDTPQKTYKNLPQATTAAPKHAASVSPSIPPSGPGEFSLSDKQRKLLWVIAQEKGFNEDGLKTLMFSMFGEDVVREGKVTTSALNRKQFDELLLALKEASKEQRSL